MLKTASGVMTSVAICAALVGCTATRHRPTTGPGGQKNTRIFCQTKTPHKCTMRANEVCGTYTVVEPLHLNPDDENESTMVVHCNPPPAVPAASSLPSGAAGASKSTEPVPSS
jgi:hypothetical protein